MRFAWVLILTAVVYAQTPQPLTLDEAEALAIKQHPRISGARYVTQAAGEVTREVRSGEFPQLFGNVTAVGTLDNSRLAVGALGAGNLIDRAAAGVTLQQLVTDFGRTSRLVESSRLRQQSQASNETFVRSQVLLDVDRAYFRVLRAQSVLRVAEQTVGARQLVVDQVTALAQSNLRSQLDVSFASVNLADARLLLVTAQNEVQAAFADLSNAMGEPASRTYSLAQAPAPQAPEPDPTQLIAQAVQNRPDLAGFRLDRDAARQFAEAEKALNRPTVSAAGAVGAVPFHDERISSRFAAAGINISIPVFNGSLFAARRTEAGYRAQAAEERLRDAQTRAARDANVAWLNASTAYQRIALTAQLLAQANLALDLVQSRYDLGLNSIVDLSQAQLNETSAQIQAQTAQYDFLVQNAVLRYELGLLR